MEEPAGATRRLEGAQQEDKERRCDNQLARQDDERGSATRGRQEAMRQPAGAMRRASGRRNKKQCGTTIGETLA
jgi:hypothetical protein